jgi:hypothetical protein
MGAMTSDLSNDDIRELAAIRERLIRETNYPFSHEASRWKKLLAKLDPEAIKPREPLPPPKVYAPPRATVARSRRNGE